MFLELLCNFTELLCIVTETCLHHSELVCISLLVCFPVVFSADIGAGHVNPNRSLALFPFGYIVAFAVKITINFSVFTFAFTNVFSVGVSAVAFGVTFTINFSIFTLTFTNIFNVFSVGVSAVSPPDSEVDGEESKK